MIEQADHRKRDRIRRPASFLLNWGIPLAILLAANAMTARPLVAASMMIAAFAWIGIACTANALHCNRVHCWFTGPWCLGVAVLLATVAFLGIRPLGLGFSTIANTGGAVALVLAFGTEWMFGRYFGDRGT